MYQNYFDENNQILIEKENEIEFRNFEELSKLPLSKISILNENIIIRKIMKVFYL